MKSLFPFVTIINNFRRGERGGGAQHLTTDHTTHADHHYLRDDDRAEARVYLCACVASRNCFMSENCWFATALDFVSGFNGSLAASLSPAV